MLHTCIDKVQNNRKETSDEFKISTDCNTSCNTYRVYGRVKTTRFDTVNIRAFIFRVLWLRYQIRFKIACVCICLYDFTKELKKSTKLVCLLEFQRISENQPQTKQVNDILVWNECRKFSVVGISKKNFTVWIRNFFCEHWIIRR